MGWLTFVRHGQASFGADDYDKLSDIGEEQSRVLGEYWASEGIEFDHVYVGPLARQRRTAELVGEAMQAAGKPWPEPVHLDGLKELPVEELGRKYIPLMMADDPTLAQLMMEFQAAEDGEEKELHFRKAFSLVMARWKSGEIVDESIETWEMFRDRVEKALDMMAENTSNGQHAVAFSSGGPNALAVRYALDACHDASMGLAWAVRNCSFSEFALESGRLDLQSVNCIPHFREPRLVTYR